MKKTLFILFISVLGGLGAKAQIDPHFSQYYAYPLWLNPALTGVMDGDFRLNANFKNQWASVGNGYKTTGVSVDYKTSQRAGVGVNIINQSAGTAGYNYLAAYGSFGYGIQLGNDYQWLNFGVQAGFINRSFDASKFQTDSQFDPSMGYNPNLPSNENLISSSDIYFDAGAGIFYHDDDPDRITNVFAGISAAHLSRPGDPFAMPGTNYKLPIRYNLHAGAKMHVSDYFAVTPHGLYVKQNKNDIKAAGVYTETTFNNETTLMLGGLYRLNDAAIINAGYRISNIAIGASYDFNTSNLSSATGGRGGIELSVSYVFSKGLFRSSPPCPKF